MNAPVLRLIAVAALPFAAGYFLSYLFRTVNAVIAPLITRELGLDAAALGLLTSAYFLAFAITQIPLGVLLDRYGPRRVDAALLLVAASGALVFALARDATTLAIGRGLIGLGVSATLMAAFTANARLWPRERLPLANALMMTAGALGATMSTLPVELFLRVADWRALFIVLALAALAIALWVFAAVPETAGHAPVALSEQWRGVRLVFASDVFWRVAPLAVATQASFHASQGLWTAGWLADVAGYARADTARLLLGFALVTIAGFALAGVLADRAARRGWPLDRVLGIYAITFLIAQAPIALAHASGAAIWWLIFALTGTGAIISFAMLVQRFPPELTGRVNTALNLLVFVGAFLAQSAIGLIVNRFPVPGGYGVSGYQIGYGVLLVLQVAALLWFARSRKGL